VSPFICPVLFIPALSIFGLKTSVILAILGIPKPNGQYQLVQDLCKVYETILPTHPGVPNP
jgi:hypothetical protein